MLLELEACQHILGHRLGRHAARRDKRVDAKHGRSPAAKGGAPGILARKKSVEEEPLLVRPLARAKKVALNRIWIEEMLGCLDDADILLLNNPSVRFKDIPEGNEIGIEEKNELGAPPSFECIFQTIVDVSGLGMFALKPGDVMHAEFFRECAHPVPRAIVQQPDPHVRMIDLLCPNNGSLEDFERLVIGCDEDIDRSSPEPYSVACIRFGRSIFVP